MASLKQFQGAFTSAGTSTKGASQYITPKMQSADVQSALKQIGEAIGAKWDKSGEATEGLKFKDATVNDTGKTAFVQINREDGAKIKIGYVQSKPEGVYYTAQKYDIIKNGVITPTATDWEGAKPAKNSIFKRKAKPATEATEAQSEASAAPVPPTPPDDYKLLESTVAFVKAEWTKTTEAEEREVAIEVINERRGQRRDAIKRAVNALIDSL